MGPSTWREPRNSVIYISSDDDNPGAGKKRCASPENKKRQNLVITILSDDESAKTPPEKDGLTKANAQVATAVQSANGKAKAEESDYGDSDDKHLIATRKQVEMMRGWVDFGINVAVKEVQSAEYQYIPPFSRWTKKRHYPISISQVNSDIQKRDKYPPGHPIAVEIHPASRYLEFYTLVEIYSERGEDDWIPDSWRTWLEQLGLDEEPYLLSLPNDTRLKLRIDVESKWALEPAEKRRLVEKLAIRAKHKIMINIQSIPLREPPVTRGPGPRPFHHLEHDYFNFQPFNGYEDLVSKRNTWLAEVGFPEALRYPLPQSSDQTLVLNRLYFAKPIHEQRAVESKARFLKFFVQPAVPSWRDLESRYELYPDTCFTDRVDYSTKRREWLQAFQLDYWPFSFSNTSDKYNELAEIAWSERTPIERMAIENHAKALRGTWNPFLHSWDAVEDMFGFSLDNDFEGDDTKYEDKRLAWLRECSMSYTLVDKADLRKQWTSIPELEKKVILRYARASKESFVRQVIEQRRNEQIERDRSK